MLLFLISLVFGGEFLYNFKKVDKIEENYELFKEIKLKNFLYKFYRTGKSSTKLLIQQHLPFLLQEVTKIKSLDFTRQSLIFTLNPYKDIFMKDKNTTICIGKYVGTFFEDDTLYQYYKGGDKCDIKKDVNRSARVSYKGGPGKLRIDKIYESKVCRYEIVVIGEELSRVVEGNVEIVYFVEENDSR
ncbi:hypothetical protein CWI39_0647p0010 [Hamiltosporidium magnivora]|uniref:MRH domain-containing protein n=1 Tax=Hamiltosporidium magnivora TaxID=148818 RepID=A0A4Q9LKQ0_9MICR|nr:hypothetical protein CWI39_0647p0010 [Hamiltosporidium magnivora]TBU08858.1 hypothetical protein CWI36_0090p0010 [Hamiltosporidium magnivora]